MNGAGSGSHLMGSILKITGVFSGTCIMNKYVDIIGDIVSPEALVAERK